MKAWQRFARPARLPSCCRRVRSSSVLSSAGAKADRSRTAGGDRHRLQPRIVDGGIPAAGDDDCGYADALTPTECIVAATGNAAAALGRHERIGAIQVGMQADLVILDVPNHERWIYEPGRNCVRTVIKKGRVVVGEAV